MMTFRLRLKKISKQKGTRLRFDLEKLKDPVIQESFKAMIGGKFAPLTLLGVEENLDTVINTFNEAVTETASQILGKHRPTKKAWVTAEILDMCDERRELKNKKGTTYGASRYREANNKIKKAMKNAKEEWIEQQCSDIEENLQKNNTKKAYQTVKDLTAPKQGRVNTIQDKKGKCLTKDHDIMKRWTEHCSDLYNHDTKGDPEVLNCPQATQEDNYPILREGGGGG